MAIVVGAATLISSAALLVCDVLPALFPPHAHDYLAAFALGAIAIAWILWQTAHRPGAMEMLKAILLAAAFLFWAANQFWPDLKQATLFNDVAVALFVLDVFLVMIGWPPARAGETDLAGRSDL